ncbi:hypothetical protein EV182_001267 [Spiromyces aspiralis]|uniref:Uncharacterized protein n=1 Tax=Spiromyces aspiralis TaxID=68401 RepID=A0ACC1HZF4_9FUNG|nr:hypothetical protein EV182_001267 [Spiromyces aspiralis]
MVNIQFSPTLISWKRTLARASLHARSLSQTSPYVRLAILIALEVVIIAVTFCTNFLSGFVFTNFFDFEASKASAINNARRVIRAERALGLFIEESVQAWNAKYIGGWSFWNTYYAGAHPVVTAGTLVVLLVRMLYWKTFRSNWKRLRSSITPTSATTTTSADDDDDDLDRLDRPFHEQTPSQQYYFLRSVWVLGAWLAFIGFVTIPTMPPRLIPECNSVNNAGIAVGACLPQEYSFMDTIGRFGSLLWDWDDPSVKTLNNPYAAFPSQHSLFAGWVAMVWIRLWGPAVRPASLFRKPTPYWLHTLGRWSIVLYPALTIYCIVVTANHYLLDAVGGMAALVISYLAVSWWTARRARSAKTSSRSMSSHEMLPI